jgi:hypothetical membrane protein
MESLFERYGRHAGLVSPLAFLVLTLAAIANFRGYDPAANYLSDLGVNPHSAILFNAGVLLSGIIGIVFSLYLWKRMPAGPAKSGAFLMGAALMFFTLLSVFTEAIFAVHFFFAMMFFCLALAAFILIGAVLRFDDGRIGGFSLLMGALIVPLPFSGFHPLAEHVAVVAILAWSLAMWAYLGRQNEYMRYEWIWM